VTLTAAELAAQGGDALGAKFFLMSISAELAATAWVAGVRDIPPKAANIAVYPGYRIETPDKSAHIIEAPCGWTTYWPVLKNTVSAHVQEYTYGEMVEMLTISAYHMEKVDYSKPKKVRSAAGWPVRGRNVSVCVCVCVCV
jgi:hypothetical protein